MTNRSVWAMTRPAAAGYWSLLLVTTLLGWMEAGALQLDIAARDFRCLVEDMGGGMASEFSFRSVPVKEHGEKMGDLLGVTVEVRDPSREKVFNKALTAEVLTLQINADEPGPWEVCFLNPRESTGWRRVEFEVKSSYEMDDFGEGEAITQEGLEPLELLFQKAEAAAHIINMEMDYMLKREAALKRTADSTNWRMQKFSWFSVTVLLCISLWQIRYLKTFFRSKKLL